MKRREFLKRAGALAAGFSALGTGGRGVRGAEESPRAATGVSASSAPESPGLSFQISLAEWSLQRSLFAGKLDNLDFPRRSRAEFGIDTVEYVDQFFKDKVRDAAYLAELRKRCESEGVRSGLIMVDTAGDLGDADSAARSRAVDLHREWMDAAKSLGCHTLRVNARGRGEPKDLAGRIVESCGKLAEHGSKIDLNVVIENHGGPSSDAEWLTGVLRQVASPFMGALPDFGNFPRETDRYAAVEKLMPFARGVSAKSGAFDAAGNDVETDYSRMMKLVFDAGFRGHVGVESSGAKSPEEEPRHIQLTRALLERVRAAQPALKPIFNGKDLEGWTGIAGGDWTVEKGVLTARNGKDWSTDPSRTGSWLRTNKEYSDFDLFLEFSVQPKSNSGIFFRSGLERNPAFTGYEMQIYDAPGTPPRKTGPGSLYDFAAPSKNRIRPAGEWNQVRVIAKGPSIRVHMNGELMIDTQGDRAAKGYIGLQNHDAKSEASFRNILLAEL